MLVVENTSGVIVIRIAPVMIRSKTVGATVSAPKNMLLFADATVKPMAMLARHSARVSKNGHKDPVILSKALPSILFGNVDPPLTKEKFVGL